VRIIELEYGSYTLEDIVCHTLYSLAFRFRRRISSMSARGGVSWNPPADVGCCPLLSSASMAGKCTVRLKVSRSVLGKIGEVMAAPAPPHAQSSERLSATGIGRLRPKCRRTPSILIIGPLPILLSWNNVSVAKFQIRSIIVTYKQCLGSTFECKINLPYFLLQTCAKPHVTREPEREA
jgi:hypothetical protein